jgi:hypothetical protein
MNYYKIYNKYKKIYLNYLRAQIFIKFILQIVYKDKDCKNAFI